MNLHFEFDGNMSREVLESYLSRHFDPWMLMYASTPEGLVAELESFAAMKVS